MADFTLGFQTDGKSNKNYVSSQTNSACLFQAEQEIKRLKEENDKLRKDLAESSTLWKQLVQENSFEKFDERRVNYMKAQMIQLEKQVLTLSEGLSSRSEAVLEVENALGSISDRCKPYITGKGSIKEVPVNRADISYIVETAESARIKLYKTVENTSTEKMTRPILMMNQYIKPKANDVTWLNICSGKLDHLNLRHIAKLESNLVVLYKELLVLLNSIQPLISTKNQEVNREVPLILYDELTKHLTKSCKLLKDTSTELLHVAVLVPSAPWSKLNKSVIKDVTTEQVMKQMPALPKLKATEVKQKVDCLQKAITYQNMMLQHEIKVLKQELALHSSVYDLQQDYMKTMFSCLSEGYGSFQKDVREMVCDPLQAILKSYEFLKKTTAEDALKQFLSKFKEHERQISDSVQKLTVPKVSQDGKDAISEFGQEYFQSLSKLQQEAMRKREKLIQELENIKSQKEEYTKECEECFLYASPLQGNSASANKLKDVSVDDSPVAISVSKNKELSPKNFVILNSEKRKDAVKVAMKRAERPNSEN